MECLLVYLCFTFFTAQISNAVNINRYDTHTNKSFLGLNKI